MGKVIIGGETHEIDQVCVIDKNDKVILNTFTLRDLKIIKHETRGVVLEIRLGELDMEKHKISPHPVNSKRDILLGNTNSSNV